MRRVRSDWVVARVALAALACVLASACEQRPRKKLIECGWDEPGPAFLRAQLARIEGTPFDGTVVRLPLVRPGGDEVSLTWRFWGSTALDPTWAREAERDLGEVRTRARRLRHNFLRVNVTPGDLDWFDDFGPVLANARLVARLARAGPCDGILLDTEQYESQLFDYRSQRRAKVHSFEEYAAQARGRGRELMFAFQQGFPRLTLLLTLGPSLTWFQMQHGPRAQRDCSYGLLAPFVDGLVAGAYGARIVDGYELSYGFREPERFSAAYWTMSRGVAPLVADRVRYRAVTSFGFGVWMDFEWRARGWSIEDPRRNYFSPEAFERSLEAALRRADEYVWIYTETPRWWSAAGGSVAMPPAYDEAVRRVRRKLIDGTAR